MNATAKDIAVATPGGFEPPISSVTGWHVRPLHHGAYQVQKILQEQIIGPSATKVYQGQLTPVNPLPFVIARRISDEAISSCRRSIQIENKDLYCRQCL